MRCAPCVRSSQLTWWMCIATFCRGLTMVPMQSNNLSRWPNQRSATGSHMLSPRRIAAMNTLSIIPVSSISASICNNQHDYLLVEFNEISIPPAMDDTLHSLRLKGLRPIITHPERNAILRRQPERLAKWARLGCFVQVTAGSLTGTFGPRAQEDSLCWIAQGFVHFVASDAHNTKRRPLRLQPAYDAVAEQF